MRSHYHREAKKINCLYFKKLCIGRNKLDGYGKPATQSASQKSRVLHLLKNIGLFFITLPKLLIISFHLCEKVLMPEVESKLNLKIRL